MEIRRQAKLSYRRVHVGLRGLEVSCKGRLDGYILETFHDRTEGPRLNEVMVVRFTDRQDQYNKLVY